MGDGEEGGEKRREGVGGKRTYRWTSSSMYHSRENSGVGAEEVGAWETGASGVATAAAGEGAVGAEAGPAGAAAAWISIGGIAALT